MQVLEAKLLADLLFLAREERRKAAAVTSSLQKGTERLKEANKISTETEDIGVRALQDLRNQRETMIRMKDNTHDVGANLEDAERAVKELDKQTCSVM
ncbi:VTI13 [Symbiodinium natans]|uniref:VTI13 protein n=1 Tax=Symbiodinium natans TaxID=878477 RepID=A0A812SLG9_9DINO|nr:VTI13 [Symbiodinium natans]